MFEFLLTKTPLMYLNQSLWRDEAFSVLTAEKPISTVIGTLNFEPPFYYILLHFWIKLFGNSEIAVRSLSLIGFSLATCVVILWAEKRFGKHWLSWVTPLFFFFNPMLLYYAFEVRAYGWLMFFATLSLYAYTQKNFRLLTIANILGFYTHTYAIFIPFVQFVHWFFSHPGKKKLLTPSHLIKSRYIRLLVINGIAIAPWFIPLYEEAKKMRPTWYYPVDFQLVKSVLGNMFIGYDGTPGGIWGYTALLSFFLIILFYLASKNKHHLKEISFFLMMVFLPLFIVVGISFIKPLFVNRYLIYVTIAQVFLISYALFSLKNALLQKSVALLIFVFLIGMNIFLPEKKAKLDIRSIVYEANMLRGERDVLYVTTPLLFFETVYYTPERHKVFLYNPENSPFPWYVGETAFSPSQMRYELPEYPERAIIIGNEKSLSVSYRLQNTYSETTTPASDK